MSTANAFAELGLGPDATETEVKAAWRRLVSRWHPDRNGNAAAVEKMQRINQAYEALLGSGLRREQADGEHADEAPAEASRANRQGSPGGAPGAGKRNGDSGGGPRNEDSRRAHRAADAEGRGASGASTAAPSEPRRTIIRKVRLTLEEAAAGCTKVLQGRWVDTCAACAGLGHRSPPAVCAACQGAGALRQRSWYGWISSMARCAPCQGTGGVYVACAACGSTGKAAARKYKLNVRIPHGARDGDVLQVDGGRGASPSPVDLEIRVEMLDHALFQLADDGTIRAEVPVNGFAWVANRSIRVPTLDGPRELSLSRDRLTYSLKGMGFPTQRRGPRADQLIEIRPIFPERLSADEDILLDQLIAARSKTGVSDDRLGAWDAAVRAWESGLPDAAP